MKQLIALLLIIAVAFAVSTTYTKSTGPLCHYTSLSDTDCAASLTYTSPIYEKDFTVPLDDSSTPLAGPVVMTTYLANSKGFIGNENSVSPLVFTPPKVLPSTSIKDWNFGKYIPLFEDSIFFVADTPVRINAFVKSTGAAGAYVIFTEGYGGLTPSTRTFYASGSGCANGDATKAWVICKGVTIEPGANSMDFAFPWDKTKYDGPGFIVVDAGADDAVDALDGTSITWVNAWDEIRYTEPVYSKSYSLPLHDTLTQTAFLAADENGLIGDPASAAKFSKGAAVTSWSMGKYFPLYADDVFFVRNTPVRVDSVTTSAAKATSYVQFTIGYGGSLTSTYKLKASDASCSDGDAAKSWVACKAVPIVGAGNLNTIDVYFPWDSAQYTGDKFIVVDRGADNKVNTDSETLAWAQGTGMTRSAPDGLVTAYAGPTPREITVSAKDASSAAITGFKVSSLGTTVVATWTTNEITDSVVKCSTSKSAIEIAGSDITLAKTHSVSLRTAAINGALSCAATSIDDAGNKVSSPAQIVTVGTQSGGTRGIFPTLGSTKPVTSIKTPASSPFRARFQSEGAYNWPVVGLVFLVVLAFCVKGTMRDAESNKRLFQWE